MATDALKFQVAAKWQDAFNRLNRTEPGISGLISFSKAWDVATRYIYPKDLNDPTQKEYDMKEVRVALAMINECRRLPAMLETFLDGIRKQHYLIEREVVAYMAEYEESREPEVIKRLVYRLVEWYIAWSPMPELGSTILSAYTLTFQTHLFSILPPLFPSGFKALCASTLPAEGDPKPLQQGRSDGIWAAFEKLGLVDRYETLIASVGYEKIEAHVLESCAAQWEKPVLDELREWMTNFMLPWMLGPYAAGAKDTAEASVMLQGVGHRFDFHLTKTLCDLRTREIFDIIVDFPDSTGALHDLKDCLQRVDQRASLVSALRKANKKRLLHPGADTTSILKLYVSSIRCLRLIDPPGVLLFKVADPIRRYLRSRPDTIRSIVANLVGDPGRGDSLVDENEPIVALQGNDHDDYLDPAWDPEPVDAGPDFRTNKSSDVISTLVSIYDSRDLFVRELQVLLAQRLLAVKDRKFDKERRNIEILKIRFGEAALQVCEVMLRDMDDSRRIDEHIQSQNGQSSIMHPTIISRHFWPTLESSEIIMPGQFEGMQKGYAKAYATFKPDKKLRWLAHLGTVSLELELADRKIVADVPPLEAAFIELFSEKDIWTVDELLPRIGKVDRQAAVKGLSTWVDLGVLKEDTENTFRLLERAEEASPAKGAAGPLPVEDGMAVNGAQQQQAEQMRVYWKFIEGMLTNLGTMPLDRIQSMLKLAPGYDRTIDQLTSFMEAAKQEGLAIVIGGSWKLNR